LTSRERAYDSVFVLTLSLIEKSVLCVLIKHSHFITGVESHPSIKRISRFTSASDRTIKRALARLLAEKFIEIQAPARQHRATTYRVHFDRIYREADRIEAGERRPVIPILPLGASTNGNGGHASARRQKGVH
jgi:hypothetical protein